MKKEFVMRGQTADGQPEVLEFGGKQKETKGMAYKLVEFELWPSTNVGDSHYELIGTITAGKVAVAPIDPNFNNEGLIAVAATIFPAGVDSGRTGPISVINDTFLITQNLILMVQDTQSSSPINWQCRFEAVKMTDAEEAATNYKQFAIFDE